VRSVVVPVVSLVVVALVAGCGGDEEGGSDAGTLEGRPWVLTSGVDVPQDVAVAWPSATFADGTVSGSTGCNQFSGPYTVDGDSLELGQLAQTQMACAPPADRIEQSYVAALGRVARWRVDGEELVLADADDAELLRYAPATPVGEWEVTGLLRGDASVSPLAGTELTARFAEDGSLSGSSGCNRYTTAFTTDKGSITIDPPAGTKKACAEPEGVTEQEAAYLAALPTAVSYRLAGSVLELIDADGKRLVTYARAMG
jgi:heat shock protein HslJ